MSKLIRTLSIWATLAAMSLVGMTAVAQANDQPAGKQVGRPPTERQVGESWRHRQAASQQQTAADTTLQRVEARERFSIPGGTPAQANIQVRQTEPSGQPSWLLPSLGVLVAALMLVGGLAARAARRTRRRARLEHATGPPIPPLDGAAAPTRQPHHLAGDGLVAYLARGPWHDVDAPVRTRLLERIPSPLTLASDLGRRRFAQR